MFTSPSKGRGLVAVPLLAILPIIFVVLLGEPPAKTRAQNAAAAKPPVAPVRVVTDEYFGVKVADPYRWMENLQDAEVAAWFKAQSVYTQNVLETIPGRAAMQARIKVLSDAAPAAVFDLRRLPGGVYFYQKRLASEEVGKLYTRVGLGGEEKLVVDPTKYTGAGGGHSSMSYYAVSQDGRSVAAGISPAGSEDAVIHIYDAQTGKEAGETIDRAEFGGPIWLPDGNSFVYNRLQKLGPSSGPYDKELLSRSRRHRPRPIERSHHRDDRSAARSGLRRRKRPGQRHQSAGLVALQNRRRSKERRFQCPVHHHPAHHRRQRLHGRIRLGPRPEIFRPGNFWRESRASHICQPRQRAGTLEFHPPRNSGPELGYLRRLHRQDHHHDRGAEDPIPEHDYLRPGALRFSGHLQLAG